MRARTGLLVTLAVSLVVRVVVFVADGRLRAFSDSGVYLVSARTWLTGDPLPLLRDRPNAFTALWAPFLDRANASDWIILAHSVLTLAAIAVFYVALVRTDCSVRVATGASVIAGCAPAVLYYEHVLLAESISYSLSLGWVALVIWAARSAPTWRYALVAAGTMVAASLVRTSFAILVVAGLVAYVVVRLAAGRLGRVAWSSALVGAAAIVLGGVAGALVGSAAQGQLSDQPALAQLSVTRAFSAYNAIAKYASLETCPAVAAPSRPRVALCAAESLAYNEVLWNSPVHDDWYAAPPDEFQSLAPTYQDEVRRLVLAHPLGAARIVVRDSVDLVLPVQHERFTTSPVAVGWLPTAAPALHIDSDFGSEWRDYLWRATSFQDAVRLIAAVALLVALSTRRLGRRWGLAEFFALTWLVSVLALAVTAYPTSRYLVPLDPLLVASAALTFARLGSRPRDVEPRVQVDAAR